MRDEVKRALVALLALVCARNGASNRAREALLAEKMKFRDEMCACKDAACATRVDTAYRAWDTNAGGKLLHDAHLDTDAANRVTAVEIEINACLAKLEREPPTIARTDVPAERLPGSSGIAECDEYMAATARILACDKIAAKARFAMRTAMNEAKEGWVDVQPALRATVAAACRDAAVAVTDAYTSVGCEPSTNQVAEMPYDPHADLPSCDAYVASTERLIKCNTISAKVRDALRTAMTQAREGWYKVEPAHRAAVDAACKQAAETIDDSFAAAHCDLQY